MTVSVETSHASFVNVLPLAYAYRTKSSRWEPQTVPYIFLIILVMRSRDSRSIQLL